MKATLYAAALLALVLAGWWLARHDGTRNALDRLLLPQALESYPALTEAPLVGARHELAKLVPGAVDTIVWDRQERRVLVYRQAARGFDRPAMLWAVAADGRTVRQLDVGEAGLPELDSARPSGETSRFEELTGLIAPFQDWEDAAAPLTLQGFVREARQSKAFYDINNTTRGGWNGTGYFQLVYDEETIEFKAYTFKSAGGYDPDLQLYELPGQAAQAVYLLEVRKPSKSNRPIAETGVYVLRSKMVD
ncbi:hypothetical protein IDH44_00345 [Paenibacillus sp. IB182496]|uniref:Uncharacterized protein n=1 Tax=Paenibacillus sabuli TaxID=2772509 RepID=A0A927BQG7_9BACL|nr:hypothetical protein [Paenibacillus sabuli]MBD2843623.1 hypothetical protein [Paenibacillus sabuli]